MKLGIVGSRDFHDYKSCKLAILKVLNEWKINIFDIECIVSGGAKGADTLAEMFADEYQIKKIIFLPDWKLYGKFAGIRRNTDIVNASTHIIAFPSRNGRGTQDTISKARNIPIKVLYID
jgi:hypothetical protein